GCMFAPRCTFAQERCTVALPELRPIAVGHAVRCVRAEEVRGHMLGHSRDGAHEERAVTQAPILALTGVSAGYRKRMVVHDVTLEVAPHECLALVGESGSGKTKLAPSS